MNNFLVRKSLSDLVPDCVPAGWWVYRWFSHWYCSNVRPAEMTNSGWPNNEGQLESVLTPTLAPKLYKRRLVIPIEQACFQVTRNRGKELVSRVKKFRDDLLERNTSRFPTAEQSASISSEGVTSDAALAPNNEGWIVNTGSKPPLTGPMKWKSSGLSFFHTKGEIFKSTFEEVIWNDNISHWKPASPEWVLHDGKGNRPVGDYEVILSNGILCNGRGVFWDWREKGETGDFDIIWYREIKPDLEHLLECWINVHEQKDSNGEIERFAYRLANKCEEGAKLFREVRDE